MMRLVQHAFLAALIATMISTVLAPPARAQTGGDTGRDSGRDTGDDWRARERAHYAACMAQVESRPKAAFDDATAWEGLSGGYPARHCALAALVALGHYGEAAQGLEKLADRVNADAAFKAKLLVQAARAWIAANDAPRARAVADAALGLTPDAADALLVRARALALLGAYWEATDDLNRVLSADPTDAEALVLRGAAYRQLDANDLALDDLNRALALAPTHPEGLLERGITHRLRGNKGAARADWRTLLSAHPESEAARIGAANLHALDSGLD